MKQYLAFLLMIVMIISGCVPAVCETPQEATAAIESVTLSEVPGEKDIETLSETFKGLNDKRLLQYVEDSVYSELASSLPSEDYIIENVDAVYVSQEYLEELAYNSQANIFFGYTLAELEEAFQGTPFVFTLGEDGETTVKPLEKFDDTYEKIIKNVAVGTGVILVCVTVSVVTGGAGLAPVSAVFAASAKTGAAFALSSGAIGGVSAGIVEGVRTKDFDAAIKAAALAGSTGFKMGAISGALVGGARELSGFRRAKKAVEGAIEHAKGSVEIPKDATQWRQAELRALNSNGGYEQLTYLNGKQVPFGTPGATRPDIVRMVGDHIEAVEVKYYNLESSQCLNTLYKELHREVSNRVVNLPAGSTQRIVLDVTGREFTETTCAVVKENIWRVLSDVYPKIPIEIVGM